MDSLIFVDASRSLDFSNIGGTNSIIRRLLNEPSLFKNQKLLLLDINGQESDEIKINSNISYRSFPGLFSLIRFIFKIKPAIIIDIYLHPFQRMLYGIFRIALRKHKYGKIYCSWPDSCFKRFLSFSDAIFFNYSGPVFCLTNRQKNYLETFNIKNVTHMWPPIPKNYFKSSNDEENKKVVITWIGRLDKGKGADLAFKILKNFVGDDAYNIRILAHSVNNSLSVSIPKEIYDGNNCVVQEVKYDGFTNNLDNLVASLLKETTIFICPYRLLSSTIDCPMLIQEAAAANCIIISKDYPIIYKIIGSSKYLISKDLDDEEIIASTIEKVYLAIEDIKNEKNRMLCHVKKLEFSSEVVSSKFYKDINKFRKT